MKSGDQDAGGITGLTPGQNLERHHIWPRGGGWIISGTFICWVFFVFVVAVSVTSCWICRDESQVNRSRHSRPDQTLWTRPLILHHGIVRKFLLKCAIFYSAAAVRQSFDLLPTAFLFFQPGFSPAVALVALCVGQWRTETHRLSPALTPITQFCRSEQQGSSSPSS